MLPFIVRAESEKGTLDAKDIFEATIYLLVSQFDLDGVIAADIATAQGDKPQIISREQREVTYEADSYNHIPKLVKHHKGNFYISSNQSNQRKRDFLQRLINELGIQSHLSVDWVEHSET